ncbi:GDP-mannose 4,6-dehydratase [Brevundimonas sp.]|uniref:GDP-mannose 4,6-dehydratase n=1 Tax=Brevundimonas sp. TaxID=1871086 RepID=UPI002FC7CF25
MTETVFITGASGFVGKRVAERLRANPKYRVVEVNGPRSERGVDLTDAKACQHLINTYKPSKIIHLAASSSVGDGKNDPSAMWEPNVTATVNLVSAFKALGQKSHLIFASSAEVYGRQFLAGPCDENAPMRPASAYGRSKAACELFLEDAASEHLSVTVARLFNHTGVGQDARFVVPSFVRQVARSQNNDGEVHVGNLDAYRDFTDVDDVVRGYELLLDQPELLRYEVYNLGSGKLQKVSSILERIVEYSGYDVKIIEDPKRMRPSDIPAAVGVFDKIKDKCGWCAEIDFNSTLRTMFDYEVELLTSSDH